VKGDTRVCFKNQRERRTEIGIQEEQERGSLGGRRYVDTRGDWSFELRRLRSPEGRKERG